MLKTKEKLIKFLGVLADNTRLDILEFLQQEKKSSAEIQGALSKSQSTISQHLKTLRDENIITFVKINNIKYYTIENPEIFKLLMNINSFIDKIEQENFLNERKKDLYDILL